MVLAVCEPSCLQLGNRHKLIKLCCHDLLARAGAGGVVQHGEETVSLSTSPAPQQLSCTAEEMAKAGVVQGGGNQKLRVYNPSK